MTAAAPLQSASSAAAAVLTVRVRGSTGQMLRDNHNNNGRVGDYISLTIPTLRPRSLTALSLPLQRRGWRAGGREGGLVGGMVVCARAWACVLFVFL